jgi:hypothetical protein
LFYLDIASHNLSKAAEQFEVYRRVVFINGITDISDKRYKVIFKLTVITPIIDLE